MDYQSEERIKESVARINNILVNNQVYLLDFSHFLSVSNDCDNIVVKTCGLQHLGANYEALLEGAYTSAGFVKYGFDRREHYFACDFSDGALISGDLDYEFGPRRNLSRSMAKVRANTEEALKWFDSVKETQMCGSGIVLARGTSNIQSNIYLFLGRKLGIEALSATRLSRTGQAQGIPAPVSAVLARIFDELNELLRDEMEETAAQRFRQYYCNVAFAKHEITNVKSNICTASTLETAKSFGHGLCVALSVGVDLGVTQDGIPDKLSRESLITFLEAYKSSVNEDGASLTWSIPNDLPDVDQWQAFVVIEGTRNAKKHFDGHTSPQIHWNITSDAKGISTMCCISSPHLIADPSAWPWHGRPDEYSMRGTHFIARLAKSGSYEAIWKALALDGSPGYSKTKFTLIRKEF